MFKFLKSPSKNWKNIEYFDEQWIDRIKILASYIKSNDIQVCDIGCGKQWLRDLLPVGVRYIPVDYVARSNDTIVCDLEKKELPGHENLTDVIFLSGVLEYISDVDWFVQSLAASRKVSISYCTLEKFPNLKIRNSYAWKNNLTTHELIKKFMNNGFKLTELDSINNNSTFCFEKSVASSVIFKNSSE